MEAQAKPDSRILRPDLIALIIAGVLGIVFFFAKFNESFPAASINLQYTRAQINGKAQQWAEKLGYAPAGSVNSTVFGYDSDAKVFLEYELGQQKANGLMRSEVPIWYWQTRFCRPFQLEELSVNLSPDGKLVGFKKSLPNTLALPTLDHAAALTIASNFLEKTAETSLTGKRLIKDAGEKQTNREDHLFVWEDEAHEFQGGRVRYAIWTSGDQVTGFGEYLHVPERFTRKYEEIRSYNELLKKVSSIIFVVLSSAIAYIFIWALISGRIRWKLALGAGVIAAALSVMSGIDSWPSYIAAYQTTTAFDQYVLQNATSLVTSALLAGIAAIFFIGALEPIYRLAFPEQVALEKIPTSAGIRSVPVIQSLIAGLSVFGLHTAYVVAFYIVGNAIGFWSPLEVRSTSTLSGLWPAFDAIEVGVNASTMEELMYRVLALFLFQSIYRVSASFLFKKSLPGSFWFANVMQAAAWAFMHSDYPQEPAYARGIELTICGIFYGYVLKRYGLLSCVLAHYTYDAFLGVTPLISSPLLLDRLTSLVAIAPGPMALTVALILARVKGKTTDVQPLTNACVAPPVAPVIVPAPESPAPFDYRPTSSKVLCGIVAAAVVGLIVAVMVPLRTVGSVDQIRVSATEATHIAAEHLLKQGLSTKSYKALPYLSEEEDTKQMQYVFEKEKFERTKELAQMLSPRLSWRVWFYKELDPEQYFVGVTPDGKVFAQWIVEDEDAVGAKPNQSEAKSTVEQFLSTVHPQFEPVSFIDSTKQEQKNRTDYSVTYRAGKLTVGEAEFKIASGTVGKYLSGYTRGWNLPDKWLFERDKVTMLDNILEYLRKAFYVVMTIALLWWLLPTVRKAHIDWRWPMTIGAVSAVSAILGKLNSMPAMLLPYDTNVKMGTYVANYASTALISVVSSTAAFGLLSALAIAVFAQIMPNDSLRTMLHALIGGDKTGFEGKRRLWLDGVIAGYGVSLILGIVDHLFDACSFLASPGIRLPSLEGAVTASQQWSPSMGAVMDAVSAGVMGSLGLILVLSFALKCFGNSRSKLFAFALISAAINYSSVRYWQDYLWSVAAFMVTLAIGYFFVTRVARKNPLAYILAGYCSTLLGVALALGKSTFTLYYADIVVILLALAAPIVYTAWLYFGPRKFTDRAQSAEAQVRTVET